MEMKSFPHQLIKDIEQLKSSILSVNPSSNVANKKRQELRLLFQTLLLTDLDFALDKKIEQDLWNIVFRNVIQNFQKNVKEKTSSKNLKVKLTLLLESATGFYEVLLRKLCFTYDLNLSLNTKFGAGLMKETKDFPVIQQPRKRSVLYTCQDCLVHLGDLARYKYQSRAAEGYYRHALKINPSNGQPYNQLALLEAASGRKLSSVFYYIRSSAVSFPFRAATTNLETMFSKMCLDGSCIEKQTNSYSFLNFFLRVHASIHLGKGKELLSSALENLNVKMLGEVVAEKLDTWQMVQMAAICMFAWDHLYGYLPKRGPPKGTLTLDEQSTADMILELMGTILQNFFTPLNVALYHDDKNLFFCNAPIKIMLDWLMQNPSYFACSPFVKRIQLWQGFCLLMLKLEELFPNDILEDNNTPLPEDWNLQGFLPLSKSHQNLDFSSIIVLSEEEANTLRALRLLKIGRWLANRKIDGKMLVEKTSEGLYIPVKAETSEEIIMPMNNLSLSTQIENKDKRNDQVRFTLNDNTKSGPLNGKTRTTNRNVAMQTILQQHAMQQQLESNPKMTHRSPPEKWTPVVHSNGSPPYLPQNVYNSPAPNMSAYLNHQAQQQQHKPSPWYYTSQPPPLQQHQSAPSYPDNKEILLETAAKLEEQKHEASKNNGAVPSNTYSLFNSSWSSGLTTSDNNCNNYYNFMTPQKFDLWSGTSPLKKLVMEQKVRRDVT